MIRGKATGAPRDRDHRDISPCIFVQSNNSPKLSHAVTDYSSRIKIAVRVFCLSFGLMERARLGLVPLGLGSPRSIQNSPTLPFPRDALIRDKCNNNNNNSSDINNINNNNNRFVPTTLLSPVSRRKLYTEERIIQASVEIVFFSLSLFSTRGVEAFD